MKKLVFSLILGFLAFVPLASADYQSGDCTEANFWYCDNQTDCEALTGDYYWLDDHCVNIVFNSHTTELEALQAIDDSVLVLRSDIRATLSFLMFSVGFILLFLFLDTLLKMIAWIGKFFDLSKYF